MGQCTALYETHLATGARMVDFGGWDMPLHYGSQIDEHHAVRRSAGMFDVSHMCAVDVTGAQARPFLRRLLANDVARLKINGRAQYSCMLNAQGGVIDDLIVYRLDETHWRVVVNAGTRDKDVAWMASQAQEFGVDVRPRTELAMLAIQGPVAREKAASLLGAHAAGALELPPFAAAQLGECFVARTGYTGEDGWELMLPATDAPDAWRRLVVQGVAPCGLGARDTLRLEAGMNLYGNDMDEAVSPLECGLTWTVALEPADRDFIGRAALEAAGRAGVQRRQVGLLLAGRGVLRAHQKVIVSGVGEGEITSGTFSPTLQRSIALARVPASPVQQVQVDIRGKLLPARVVKYPFVRHGRACIELPPVV